MVGRIDGKASTAMNGGQPELEDFILRRLEDEDRERLEEALFSDDALFERMVDVEHGLVDDWARGRLTEEQRRRVESTLGSGARGAERLRFARSLVQKADSAELAPVVSFRRRVATWTPVAAAAAIALIVTGLWMTGDQRSPAERESLQAHHQSRQERRPVAPPVPLPRQESAPQIAEAPRRTADPAATTPTPATSAQPRISPAILAVSLAVVRSEGVEPNVQLAADQPLELTIRLDPQDRFDSYVVEIADPSGETVHRDSSVAAAAGTEGPTIVVKVPAGKLEEGIHEAAVSADGMDLGWITFRVDRR